MGPTTAANQRRVLFQSERQREIVARTLHVGRIDVREMARDLQVTAETIRRDLSDLQNQRLVRRVHGGAVPWNTRGLESLLAVQDDRQVAEKRRIARLAVQEVPDSGTIIIDSGSTLTLLAEYLPHDRQLQVVTNSLLTAQVLAQNDAIDVIVLGGRLRKDTLAMVGAETVADVARLRVDTLFMSSDAMSAQGGLTTSCREEAAFKAAMMAAAGRVVALVDSSTMDTNHLIRFACWSDINVVVTDTGADDAAVAQVEASGPTVLRA